MAYKPLSNLDITLTLYPYGILFNLYSEKQSQVGGTTGVITGMKLETNISIGYFSHTEPKDFLKKTLGVRVRFIISVN